MSRLPATRRKAARYHHGDLKNALIASGVDILSKEGVAGLSLRKVAQKAGVSHTAPYAHFTDKQALIGPSRPTGSSASTMRSTPQRVAARAIQRRSSSRPRVRT